MRDGGDWWMHAAADRGMGQESRRGQSDHVQPRVHAQSVSTNHITTSLIMYTVSQNNVPNLKRYSSKL